MLTNLFAVIIVIVVFFAIFIAIGNSADKSINKKEKEDKEIAINARVFFKRHLNAIEDYIKETLPGMRGGINQMNVIVISNDCLKFILIKDKEELKNIPNFMNSPEGGKLKEMVHTYVSFLVDKHYGGIGSSSEQLEYNYGAFLRENDISMFYYDKETKKLV
ncbi:MAG: hypothetical protein WCW57_06490 [Candidatus Pacearchaeota archaeon]